jgi:hypothetical protein
MVNLTSLAPVVDLVEVLCDCPSEPCEAQVFLDMH